MGAEKKTAPWLDSHRNSVQNAPVESSTALTATLFVKNHKFDPDPKKMSSQSCSHRNSVQNAPIESSTALVGTTFVTISVFMSSGNFWTAFGQHLDNFWTTFGQLLDNMWATFGNFLDNYWAFVWQLLDNFWTTYGQLLGNFRATTMGDKKCVNKTRLWSFLFFGDDLRVYFSYPWISSHWYQVYVVLRKWPWEACLRHCLRTLFRVYVCLVQRLV